MTAAEPLMRIAVGVVVERRKAGSPWLDCIWRPVALLSGKPSAEPWTQLTCEGDTATFYADTADIDLYRSETDNYRMNLDSGTPSIWVALHATGGNPPFAIAAVTADPAEGEGLTEAGQAIVEAVPMPSSIREAIASFVARHPVQQPFEKRKRDRADPEALARRGPLSGGDHER